ncbi:hypothetical protein L596_028766 [Steinernema carpocapsae]|uniref:Uncharacterized protein n=1 Tax=Steinernema carpocapsae TaxID=34508 RepID=A0A4U5LZA6_STECR|nr:hypothetical protein L596_028766 [Steinernema carpocapsae]
MEDDCVNESARGLTEGLTVDEKEPSEVGSRPLRRLSVNHDREWRNRRRKADRNISKDLGMLCFGHVYKKVLISSLYSKK